MTLSPVALPIVWNGQVVNYVFVTAKVMLTWHADEFALRDKEPSLSRRAGAGRAQDLVRSA